MKTLREVRPTLFCGVPRVSDNFGAVLLVGVARLSANTAVLRTALRKLLGRRMERNHNHRPMARSLTRAPPLSTV